MEKCLEYSIQWAEFHSHHTPDPLCQVDVYITDSSLPYVMTVSPKITYSLEQSADRLPAIDIFVAHEAAGGN
jgi:hypothetical protein